MKEKGQALITLIIAAAVAISVLTTATMVAINQGKSSSRNELGRKVYYAAEAGVEYALIKLMRDPLSCTGTESLSLASANVTITYTPVSGTCSVSSKAEQAFIIKTISVQASYNLNQVFNYSGWVETQ
jgi:type II secretory pathway component PulK